MTPLTDWKRLVGAVAPTLAAALGGPLAGVATQALSAALLGRDGGTDDEIATAILTGGTDALERIKRAETDFQIRMRELDIDLERIHQGDRVSARDREARTGDRAPAVLASVITLGFFGVLLLLMRAGLPAEGEDALLVLLGSLGTAWASVVAYYFGSSSGSARKTAAMERMGKAT